MATSESAQHILPLRVVCLNPPPVELQGVSPQFGLQDKSQTLHSGVLQPDGSMVYACQATVRPRLGNSPPDFAGPFIHGAKGDRFLYISLRNPDGGWKRRLKVTLAPITWAQIGMVANGAGAGMMATIDGRGAARVALIGGGWALYAV
jgi:hypothetical protein